MKPLTYYRDVGTCQQMGGKIKSGGVKCRYYKEKPLFWSNVGDISSKVHPPCFQHPCINCTLYFDAVVYDKYAQYLLQSFLISGCSVLHLQISFTTNMYDTKCWNLFCRNECYTYIGVTKKVGFCGHLPSNFLMVIYTVFSTLSLLDTFRHP